MAGSRVQSYHKSNDQAKVLILKTNNRGTVTDRRSDYLATLREEACCSRFLEREEEHSTKKRVWNNLHGSHPPSLSDVGSQVSEGGTQTAVWPSHYNPDF